MPSPLRAGIIGCGDFLRINEAALAASREISIQSVFDLDGAAGRRWAEALGAKAAGNVGELTEDPDIDLLLVFTPPWARREQIEAAARGGKHLLTTKPLAPNEEDGRAMVEAVDRSGVRCGVMYRRTGDRDFEALRALLVSGEWGPLALFRMEWCHHFPQWNRWALDPAKNGGPFMDAMIHNLNIARTLMGRHVARGIFFGDKLSHELPCNDTESLRLEFTGNGIADLFITWAADLEVTRTDGNFREHHEALTLVTGRGYRLTREKDPEGKPSWAASKEGKKHYFPIEPIPGGTIFDRFARAIRGAEPLPMDLPGIGEAFEDIRIIRRSSAAPGVRIQL